MAAIYSLFIINKSGGLIFYKVIYCKILHTFRIILQCCVAFCVLQEGMLKCWIAFVQSDIQSHRIRATHLVIFTVWRSLHKLHICWSECRYFSLTMFVCFLSQRLDGFYQFVEMIIAQTIILERQTTRVCYSPHQIISINERSKFIENNKKTYGLSNDSCYLLL